ncbi:MAG TPA: DUF177 domain-containing protein [Chloroflexota bacterium]|nr:DUF177 domain-containing protein [Chloroflexota bacterium]
MSALRINVAGLLKETAGAAREYPINAPASELTRLLEREDGARGVRPLLGSVRLMRTQQSVFVRGRLSSQLAVECSRCLAEARVPVKFDVEAEYFPEVDIVTGHGLPKPDDDLAFTIDQNHELDLSEAVRQHLLLEMPMQAVCRETCAGLCPRCGANLNEAPCGCPQEAEDDRFAPLKALLEQARSD